MPACDLYFFWLWLMNSHSPGQTSFQLRFFWQPLNPMFFFLFSPHLLQCCAHRIEWQLWIQQSPRLGIDQGEYFHSSILKTLVSTQLLPHRLPIISALFFLNEIKTAFIDKDYRKQNSSFCLENWVNPIVGFIIPTWRLLHVSLMEPLHIREHKWTEQRGRELKAEVGRRSRKEAQL